MCRADFQIGWNYRCHFWFWEKYRKSAKKTASSCAREHRTFNSCDRLSPSLRLRYWVATTTIIAYLVFEWWMGLVVTLTIYYLAWSIYSIYRHNRGFHALCILCRTFVFERFLRRRPIRIENFYDFTHKSTKYKSTETTKEGRGNP